MIVDSEILIVGHSRNLRHYRNLGYELNVGDSILVKPEHLMRGSTTIINCQCDKCGSYTRNTFKDYWNYTNGLINTYYCNKCKYIKSEVTCMGKYGVSNPMKDADILEKLRNNLLQKYGVSWYSKTDEWLEKYKLTSNENWGVDNPSKSPVIIDKIKMMNNQRYGVDWVMQNSDVRAKSILSYRKNWGAEHISKTEYFHEKIRQTSMSNWGVDHYSKTDEYKIRVINTNLREYGGYPMATDKFKEISKLTKERKTFRKYSQLISDDYELVSYKDSVFKIQNSIN